MKVINKSYMITDDELHNCIELLNKKYKNLNCKITLYQSKWSVIWRFPFSSVTLMELKNILKGTIGGMHFSSRDNIELYLFCNKYNGNEFSKIQIIFDLFHEIRHNYQEKNFNKKYPKACNNYINNYDNETGYDNQWIEKDANGFAKSIMNKNHDKISKLLNTYNTWSINIK